MSTTVSYKGNTIATLSNETKTLTTAGTWVEGDMVITDSGSGGREDLCEPKAVNFMDYDGRLLYSYTVNEFMALTALPPNPTNEGLTAQGWNWSLEDAKEQVAISNGLLIGQMYIPSDGNTHINISIPYSGRKVMLLRFGQTVTNGVIVNWGDGNVDTISETAVANHTHTYEKGGMYKITIEVSSGQIKWNSSNNYFITGQLSSSENNSCRTYISSIYLGGGFTTFGSADNITGLQTVKIVTVPKGVTSISIRGIAQNPSLQALVIPNTATSIGEYTFQQNYAMKRISFSDSLVAYSTGTLKQTYSIESFYIHKDCTAIPNNMFYRSNALGKLVIPSTVTRIGTEAFYQCYALQELHLLPTTPPTLANTNAFTGVPSDCVFYVPYSEDHSILDAYKTATNWSTYASRIQEESQS